MKNTSCLLYLNLVLEKESKIWTSGRKCGQQEGPLQISVVLLLSFSKKLDLGEKKKKRSKSCKLLCHTMQHPTFPSKRDLASDSMAQLTCGSTGELSQASSGPSLSRFFCQLLVHSC